MQDTVIQDSTIDEAATLYLGSRIVGSTVVGASEVGDFARVYDSTLEDRNRIGRHSLIYHSVLGKLSYTGSNSVIMHSDVGKFSSISWNVTVGPANHDYSRLSTHDFLYDNRFELRPDGFEDVYDRFHNRTTIGNDVWIGTGAVVMNGVSVGDGAVIGANATVTKNVDAYSIVVGSPAKAIGRRFSDEIVHALLDIKWWEFEDDAIRSIYPLLYQDVTIELLEQVKEAIK